jgi:solute carrier family 24 (sodium/potassium/calcium exchanger), member 6
MEDSFGATGKVIAIVPVCGLLMLIFMYTLSSTADDYLSPSLEFLTDKLQISESLAGVTLLALGNGAPDIFAAISAAGGGSEGSGGTLLTICNLVGSTLFISTIVQLMTVGASLDKRIKVTPVFFLRDLIFYILTCLYILAIILYVK